MSDELFRARVEPRRARAQASDGPPPADRRERSDEVLDDLVASFGRGGPAGRTGGGNQGPESPSASAFPDPADPAAAPAAAVPGAWQGPDDGTDPATLPSRRSVKPRRRIREPWLIGGAALAVTAGVTAVVASSTMSGGNPAARATSPATSAPFRAPLSAPATSGTAPTVLSGATPLAAAQVADWIVAHVGPGHYVACDVAVCGLLGAHGFPPGSLVPVQSGLADVERADVVVVTDVLRHQLGAALAGVTAAEPLAVVGADASAIAVMPVALGGPAAYTAKLAADREARKAAGQALVHNPRIVLSPAARTDLAEGKVDGRICTLLAAVLGDSHGIVVASFTGAGPGAGPDYPLPGVVISGIDGVPAAGGSPQAARLAQLVQAQRPPYAPLSVTRVATAAGQGSAILFAQPGRLGLLTGGTS